jgi:ubiquinone/menaquinone biosynthesis C-methylase UbiE
MTDIDLYQDGADLYESLQEKRPDYTGARKALKEFFNKYLNHDAPLVVADFCCGTGNNTRLLSELFLLKKSVLIDVNQTFLDLAEKSGILANKLVKICSDILSVSLSSEHDAVIAMFAYHHVPDSRKYDFLKISYDALKPGGYLYLGEIYSPNRDSTLAYYEALLRAIPLDNQSAQLTNFLMQTAQSDSFEYKVSRQYAHNQLLSQGFILVECRKVWPADGGLDSGVGTYLEVWQKPF